MKPKICVPLVGHCWEELSHELELLKQNAPDLVEWRVDLLEHSDDIFKILPKVVEGISPIPLIFTWRTKQEGGRAITPTDYHNLLIQALESGLVDLLDVEFFFDETIVSHVIALAKEKAVSVVTSNHDFQKTPSGEEITNRLLQMKQSGATIGKIAVMPQTAEDVITVLSATQQFTKAYPEFPIITMSMGDLGKISRVSGMLTGSCVTFATVGEASAPGQLSLPAVQEILSQLEL